MNTKQISTPNPTNTSEDNNLKLKKAKPKFRYLPITDMLGSRFNGYQELVNGMYITNVPTIDYSKENWLEAVAIMQQGAEKYSLEGWKKVPITEYYDALLRHAFYSVYSKVDKSSGFLHTSHCLCNVLIIGWHRNEKQTVKSETWVEKKSR